MSIRYALLGLLAHTPRHGYDLKHHFEAHFSHLRSLNAGQIYFQLARLTAEGLVSSETITQKNSPSKKIYTLTEQGRQELLEWLAQPLEANFEQVRNHAFIKLMVHALVIGSQTDEPGSREMIERQRARLEESLARLKQTRLQSTLVLGPGESDPRTLAEQEQLEVQLILIEGVILHLEAELNWLSLVETRLERLLTFHRTQP